MSQDSVLVKVMGAIALQLSKSLTHSRLQVGDGGYIPQHLVPKGAEQAQLANGLCVQIFQYAPNLDSYMRNAALIISHAGSGSLFEALRLGKPLVAVPNAILMANHQAELVSTPCSCACGREHAGKSLNLRGYIFWPFAGRTSSEDGALCLCHSRHPLGGPPGPGGLQAGAL